MKHEHLCPVVQTAKLISKKWDLIVIRFLLDGPKRFVELKAEIPEVSSKSLSATLKQLSSNGMIDRKVESTFPVSVIYSLTKMGREMGDIVEAMRTWGEKWALPYATGQHRRG
jgi:DNA-binding HxlR family transcriptional regulator